MYNELVMDHFTNPRNMRELKDANGVGEVTSAVCGDMTKMYLKIEDDVIQDAAFKTFGCGAAIASSSIATELIRGKTIDEALNMTNAQVVEQLGGLPEAKIHCSVLAQEAIKMAVDNYRSNKNEK